MLASSASAPLDKKNIISGGKETGALFCMYGKSRRFFLSPCVAEKMPLPAVGLESECLSPQSRKTCVIFRGMEKRLNGKNRCTLIGGSYGRR